MDVEFRYFEDCSNWQEAVADLETALGDAGWSGEITMTRVETAEAADRLGFRGSPSIILDGEDPFIDESAPVGLSCRVYRTPDGLQGSPGVTVLREEIDKKV